MTLAERLAALTERLASEPVERKGAVVDELRRFVMSTDPVQTAEDALAFQTFAMSLSHMINQSGVPAGGSPLLDTMHWSMRRAAMYLEAVSGETIGDIVSEVSSRSPGDIH